MSQNYQQAARRKENIAAIEPLISAMRTISLSQWRMALNRYENLDAFTDELGKAFAILRAQTVYSYAQSRNRQEVLIILGSNRGLCGNFNKHLQRFVRAEGMTEKPFSRIILTGDKLPALFKDLPDWNMHSFPFPEIDTIPQAHHLFSLASVEELQDKAVIVLYNKYQGAGRFKTVREQIYPLAPVNRAGSPPEARETIIDTDVHALTERLMQLSFSTRLQSCLYSSMASEHSARFALMENADQNIENLTQELEILLQEHRKGKITAETQELAISSGLLKI